MRRMAMIVSMAVAVVAAGWLPALAANQGSSGEERHPLVGSWEVVISYEGQGAITVANLVTFGADGTLLAASAGQLPDIPGVFGTGLVLTEGHGAWAATGERSADGTYRSLTLDQTGSISSTNVARMSVAVDPSGNSYSGTFSLELISPNGNPMGSGMGTVRAERISVESLATPIATPTA